MIILVRWCSDGCYIFSRLWRRPQCASLPLLLAFCHEPHQRAARFHRWVCRTDDVQGDTFLPGMEESLKLWFTLPHVVVSWAFFQVILQKGNGKFNKTPWLLIYSHKLHSSTVNFDAFQSSFLSAEIYSSRSSVQAVLWRSWDPSHCFCLLLSGAWWAGCAVGV